MNTFRFFSHVELTVLAYGRAPEKQKIYETKLLPVLEGIFRELTVTQHGIAAARGHSWVVLKKEAWRPKDGEIFVRGAVLHVKPEYSDALYCHDIADSAYALSHIIGRTPVQCRFGEVTASAEIRAPSIMSRYAAREQFEWLLKKSPAAEPRPAPARPERHLRSVPRRTAAQG